MSGPAIEARALHKRYGAAHAVRGISFDIEAASCVGLLGPNGAGKTTTMRMIMGLAKPSEGALSVFGTAVERLGRAERARIGLVPQEDNLDPDLSVRRNLEVYGLYFALPAVLVRERIDRLLAFVQLSEKADARVNQLSGGMKRRLVIARALIAEPELLILDEPTTGLDPQARVVIWQLLRTLKSQGKTLLLTTHYMDEAQRLCDRIVLIDGGQILDEGTPEELIGRHVKGEVIEVKKPLPPALEDATLTRDDIGDAVLFYTTSAAQVIARLPEDTVYLHRPANLEDAFLRLTGRALREA